VSYNAADFLSYLKKYLVKVFNNKIKYDNACKCVHFM
jgi:hypothetical protein